VTRLLPDTITAIEKLDRLALILLGPLGKFVAGRVVLVGTLRKAKPRFESLTVS
jgi:hypothetical protein